jgi:hypothetical protein
VNGVLTIADTELVTALRELADHMDLCGPGLLIGNLTGLSINDRLRVTWSIRVPSREQLTEVLGQPDPMVGYRLLTLTVPPPITWTPEKGYGVVGLGCGLPT